MTQLDLHDKQPRRRQARTAQSLNAAMNPIWDHLSPRLPIVLILELRSGTTCPLSVTTPRSVPLVTFSLASALHTTVDAARLRPPLAAALLLCVVILAPPAFRLSFE